ncbi:MAG: cupin domain-containing protein [Chlamydiales bacterium]|nr:cupin domain-containing protein [Chlamydiales bacterium]
MLDILAVTEAIQVNENLTIYPVVPTGAGQGWKCELFKLAESIPPHYHKIQKQIILVVEGVLKCLYGNKQVLLLQEGEFLCINPGVTHSLIPEGTVQFFAINLPGFQYPEDVFEDIPSREIPKWNPPLIDALPALDPKHFKSKIDAGDYAVYELINGTQTNMKWSAALLEIHDSPKHFHQIEKEVFIVVGGKLAIESEEILQVLSTGESLVIYPDHVHQLKSASDEPVRVLCFSFPAYELTQVY